MRVLKLYRTNKLKINAFYSDNLYMKKLLNIIILLVIINQAAISQKDSILVTKGEKDSIDMKYDRIYKLIVQDKNHDVKHLWKINLALFSLSSLNVGYQQNIGTNWTIETFLFAGFGSKWSRERSLFGEFGSNISALTLSSLQFGLNEKLKFYYDLSRRKNLGKITNGYSGNYFALGGYLGYQAFPEPFMDTQFDYKNDPPFIYYSAYMHYGIQRRIGSLGFFELFAGIRYDYLYSSNELSYPYNKGFMPDGGFKFGFAIESLKELKKIFR
jgi:hypothetical protein